jgi:hypothetical protein
MHGKFEFCPGRSIHFNREPVKHLMLNMYAVLNTAQRNLSHWRGMRFGAQGGFIISRADFDRCHVINDLIRVQN